MKKNDKCVKFEDIIKSLRQPNKGLLLKKKIGTYYDLNSSISIQWVCTQKQ